MVEYDAKVLIGHYDLISWFREFALYIGTQLVHVCEHTYFTIYSRMTRPLTLKHLILRFSDFALYLGTNMVQKMSWTSTMQ